MAKPPTFVGIDLGTTYSAVGYLNNHGKAEICPNERSRPVTPSVVYFPEGRDEEPVVGERAKHMARFSPDRVVECVKRHMGDASVDFTVGDETYSPEEISAIILRELRTQARLHLNREVAEAVITVPAYFDDGERHATKLAGELAGFKVLGILNEPTAAALAFGLDHAVETGKALIYDLGGGTFDVTVVELNGGDIQVLATDGVRLLGGVDWNSKLMEYVAHEFMVKYGPDPREDLKSAQRLAEEVEAAKRSLSSHTRAKLFIECGDVAGQILITREKFEDLTEGLLLQTEAYTEAVLEKAELDWSDIDRILLAGGSTRMPMVRSMLRELSGMEPDTSLNPDECVAIGAAYFATRLKKDGADAGGGFELERTVREVAENISVKNVSSHSIGIRSVVNGRRKNLIMIPEQTQLPAEVTRNFATHADNQVTVEINVLEGESDDPADCSILGKTVITGLPKNRPRGSVISVTYEHTAEGILKVRARDYESGRSCETTISRGMASDAPEHLKAMKARLDALYMLEGETGETYQEPAPVAAPKPRAEEVQFQSSAKNTPVAEPERPLTERLDQSRLPGEILADVSNYQADEVQQDTHDDYDDYRDNDAYQGEDDAGVVNTMQLRKIQDEMSSIADPFEEAPVAEEEHHEPASYDEDLHSEQGENEFADPWQMAAEQGLLDGEVVSADSPYESDQPDSAPTESEPDQEEDGYGGYAQIHETSAYPTDAKFPEGFEQETFEEQDQYDSAESQNYEEPYEQGYEEGYEDGAYDEEGYSDNYEDIDTGHYDDGQYNEGQYEEGQHDEGQYDDSYGEGDYHDDDYDDAMVGSETYGEGVGIVEDESETGYNSLEQSVLNDDEYNDKQS